LNNFKISTFVKSEGKKKKARYITCVKECVTEAVTITWVCGRAMGRAHPKEGDVIL
jgi:hypothetical protein